MQNDDDEETHRRQARWNDNQNARPQLSGTSKGDAGSRSSALSSARVHEDESWSRGRSETVNKDDDEETQHRQARWKDNQNARPQLSETSKGDA